MKLSITYSKEFEFERVKNTINRLAWYSKYYNLKSLTLPKSISFKQVPNLSDNDIIAAINEEYDMNKYLNAAELINQIYPKYEKKLEELISNMGLIPIPKIKARLTIYGMVGSYHSPDEVITNIDRLFNVGLIMNILHEIIHLHIEPLIQKYQVDQWGKETIVNLLFEKTFPEIYKKPNIPINTEEIEKIFNEYYPDIEKIIHATSQLQSSKV